MRENKQYCTSDTGNVQISSTTSALEHRYIYIYIDASLVFLWAVISKDLYLCVYIYICSIAVVDELRRFGHRGKYDINTVQFLAQTDRFVS